MKDMLRVEILLAGVQAQALKKLAYRNLRRPREQARWMIENALDAELEGLGLDADGDQQEPAATGQVGREG